MKIHTGLAAAVLATMSAFLITPMAICAESSSPGFQIVDYPSGPIDKVRHTTLLKLARTGRPTLQIGYADVAQGVRLPTEGSVSLPVDDIGVMLAGHQTANISGQDIKLHARQLVRALPFAAQSAVYDEPTKLLFIFFGDMVENPEVPNPKDGISNTLSARVWSKDDLARTNLDAAVKTITLLKVDNLDNPSLHIGIAQIPAGDKSDALDTPPPSTHLIKALLKGKVRIEVNGVISVLHPGDIVLTPSGTKYNVEYLENTEIAYIFYGEEIALH